MAQSAAKRQENEIEEAVSKVRNPSATGPMGNPGNHGNQGFKNAKQVAELEVKYPNAEEFVTEQGSISGAIRFLASEGYEVGAIAKFLGKRYQHVRNVLNQPVNQNQNQEDNTD